MHTIVGETVNTASRIEGQAPAGGVAIGPQTRARLSGAETTPLGRLDLKGKAEPVEVHLLRSLGPALRR
ncbi:MAG TPA: adenylate/guanylate cyclase domain-containing protein [Dermatophilaceae bacterium]|nr:adenylate/guanylate cyclase domain-containing protein [Dermatophilaceae bacterium]